jgi:PAS domain S-box-containing protein
MSKLSDIQSIAQKVASTIAIVLKIETMIFDKNLQIIAGTGKYFSHIGDYEKEVYTEGEYLYKYLLRTGGTYIVDDVNDPLYGKDVGMVELGEMGEISCVITHRGYNIGLICLVAFTKEQYKSLLDNRESICAYLIVMAELLSAYIGEQESFNELQVQAEQLSTIVESSSEAFILLSSEGKIKNCNTLASKLIGIPKEDLTCKNINLFWENAMTEFMKYRKGVTNREFCITQQGKSISLLVSIKPIILRDEIETLVVFFRDATEAKQQAYMTKNNVSFGFDSIYGRSPQVESVKELAKTISHSDSTVLITGESGTGKEMFASAIHNSSNRAAEPFITINCGAIPETLLESELFGYVSGAFTGASKGGHIGKFELANKGTIFVDEIGDLQLQLQVKLLHVIQRRQIERIGDNKQIDIDVRIIAATNKDLLQMCKDGSFREDLYYRINVIPIYIPPLRDRPEDIEILANIFVEKYSMMLGKEVKGLTDETLTALSSHNWPGNVRELENVIEYSVNITNHPCICFDDLTPLFKLKAKLPDSISEQKSLKESLADYENLMMLRDYARIKDGTLTRTELAKQLGIGRTTLYRKLKDLSNQEAK